MFFFIYCNFDILFNFEYLENSETKNYWSCWHALAIALVSLSKLFKQSYSKSCLSNLTWNMKRRNKEKVKCLRSLWDFHMTDLQKCQSQLKTLMKQEYLANWGARIFLAVSISCSSDLCRIKLDDSAWVCVHFQLFINPIGLYIITVPLVPIYRTLVSLTITIEYYSHVVFFFNDSGHRVFNSWKYTI